MKLSVRAAAPQSAHAQELSAQTVVELTVGAVALGLNHLMFTAALQLFVDPLLPLMLQSDEPDSPMSPSPAGSPAGSPAVRLGRHNSSGSSWGGSSPSTPKGLARSVSLFSVGSNSEGHVKAVKPSSKSGLLLLPSSKRFAKKWKSSGKKDLPVLQFDASLVRHSPVCDVCKLSAWLYN